MYHPKKNPPNPILWSIIGGILLLHVIALVVFGGFTLYEAIRPTDPTFDEPPPAEKIERVKLEYKVRMQEQQKKSARPKQKLQVRSVENVTMPDVSIQVPTLGDTGNIGRFGGGNFGDLGDGGGLDVGGVSVELFDIKAKGEKFLFVIDVNKDLLQDSKGGIPTYDVIKEDLTRLIMDLPSGILFNVMLFDRGRVELWRPNLVAASKANKESFSKWLEPINSSAQNVGVRNRNYTPKSWNTELAQNLLGTQWKRGNEIFVATMGILEQRPDAVYLFTDELPSMGPASYRDASKREAVEEEYLDRLEDAGFSSIAAYEAARKSSVDKVRDRIANIKRNEANKRKSSGLPPRVYSRAEGQELRQKVRNDLIKNDPEFVAPIYRNWIESSYSEREMESFFERLMRLEYDQNSAQRPALNAIIFKGEDEEWTDEQDDNVDDFVDYFDGEYRVLKGLGAIDSEKFQ